MYDDYYVDEDATDIQEFSPATDEELQQLSKSFDPYDDPGSDTDWNDNLELETGIHIG